MSDGLGIVHIDWAILLMGVVPVTWLLWYLLTRRRRRGERMRVAPKRSATFEVSVVALILVAWAIATLRPFSGFEDVEVSVGGRDIIAIVDVSNSMLATDVSPSRLGLVRRKLHDLLRLVNESGRRDRVGVVVFAGSAQVFCPLTSDFTALRNFINAISHELLVQGGTNLPAAMEVALASLPASSSGRPLLLLFSDGGDELIDAEFLRSRLGERGVPVMFLGVGTAEGGRVLLPSGQPVIDRSGRVVVSRLNQEVLARAAEDSGGRYRILLPDDGDLHEALQYLGEVVVEETEALSSVRLYGEIGPLILQTLLLLLVALFAIGKWQIVLPLVLLMLCRDISVVVAQSEERTTPHTAWKALDGGQYEIAEKLFNQLIRQSDQDGGTPDARLYQGLGSAQYRQGDFSGAQESFDRMEKHAQTRGELFDALYSRGNSELEQGKFDQAIASYEQSLLLRPDEERATHNREVAKLRKALAEKQQERSDKEDQDHADKKPPESPPEESDKGTSPEKPDQQESSAEQDQSGSESSEDSKAEQDSSSASDVENSDTGTEGESSSESASNQNSSAAEDSEPNDAEGDDAEPETPAERARPDGDVEQDSQAGRESENRSAQKLPTHDPQALRKQEAETWLESLPDSPMIPRSEGRRPQRQGVNTW